jgi:Transposase DDE domain/Insertion element 4 transposase N-terminal
VVESVTSASAVLGAQGSPGSLRDAVLAGPGPGLDLAVVGSSPLAVVASPQRVRAALAAAGYADKCRGVLTGAVTTVLVLGLCLYCGQGYAGVIGRLWPLLGWFNPALVMGGPVSAVALSQARARLPAGVLRAVFAAGAAAGGAATTAGSVVFGLVVTAVDGTVLDLAATDAVRERFSVPSGGRFPQARVVTLVACGTRRVLAAEVDSCGVSEQRLWDRLVGQLRPGTLNLADRNFFSMGRWRAAAATGAHLVWRVKNGVRSLPATLVGTAPDGSQLVRLRESDAMLARRRKATGQAKAARLEDMTARLVTFTVTVTDPAGQTTTSTFRVLTTLLDHETHPAAQVAACYAERWQVELAYKTVKTHAARHQPAPAWTVPRPGRAGGLGAAGRLQRRRRPGCSRRRGPGHRPRPDLLHLRPARHPRPPHPTVSQLRPPRRPGRPHRRDHRRTPKPYRPDPHRTQNHQTTTNPTRPQRHLHYHNHQIKPTWNDLNAQFFRAVGPPGAKPYADARVSGCDHRTSSASRARAWIRVIWRCTGNVMPVCCSRQGMASVPVHGDDLGAGKRWL